MAGLDKFWKNRVLLVKGEATAGVDAAPTVADDAMLAFNVGLTIESDEQSRNPDKGYYSAPEKTYTNKRVTLTGEIEMAGSGTAGTPPAIGPLIIGCGFDETVTAATSVEYLPVSGSSETVTIYLNIDGVLFKALGAKGSLSINPAIGSYNKANFTFTGLYLTPVDDPLAAGDFSGFIAPEDCSKENSTLTVGGVNVDGQSLNYEQGNDNQLRESTETKLIANLDRQGSAQISCWMNPLSDFNPYTSFDAHTKVAIEWTTGLTAGNITKYTMASALLGAPQPADLNGVAGYNIPVTPYSTGAGDNEISILFT